MNNFDRALGTENTVLFYSESDYERKGEEERKKCPACGEQMEDGLFNPEICNNCIRYIYELIEYNPEGYKKAEEEEKLKEFFDNDPWLFAYVEYHIDNIEEFLCNLEE